MTDSKYHAYQWKGRDTDHPLWIVGFVEDKLGDAMPRLHRIA